MSNTALGAKVSNTKNKHMVLETDARMLKIRLQGTEEDIEWFWEELGKNETMDITNLSELYRNKGTNRYYRAYAEILKTKKNK